MPAKNPKQTPRNQKKAKKRKIPPPMARKAAAAAKPALKKPRKKTGPSPAQKKTKYLRAERIFERLQAAYPDAKCALDHENPFQLLVATILSAQSTDKMVNTVTPALFRKYGTASQLADADTAELEG